MHLHSNESSPALRWLHSWLLLGLPLLAGCFQANYDFQDNWVKCGDGNSCPPGYTCALDGYCYRHLPDALSAEPDAPVPDVPIGDAPVPDAPVPDAPLPDAPLPDARVDAPVIPPADAPIDAPIDAPLNPQADGPPDARVDAPLDAPVDARVDAPVDAPPPDAPPPVCSPGTKQCNVTTNTPQTCSTAGQWEGTTPCSNQTCVSGACQGECDASKWYCTNNQFRTCDSAGHFSAAVDCTAQNKTCNASKAGCSGTVTDGCYGSCTPGTTTCTGSNTYVTCDPCGSMQQAGTCGTDICVSLEAGNAFCGCPKPGLTECSGMIGRQCGDTSLWETKLTCTQSGTSCCICLSSGSRIPYFACKSAADCTACQ